MSNNYDDLIERVTDLGIDIDEPVFILTIADIIGELVYLFDPDNLSNEQLLELIDRGKKGTNLIKWCSPILEFLKDKGIKND